MPSRCPLLYFTLGLLAVGLGLQTRVPAQTASEFDEQILKSAGLPTDDKGLLQYFRLRSLKDDDRKQMQEWVDKLSSEVFRERDQATKELKLRGALALPFLKESLKTASLETARRAELLIKDIESKLGPEQPIAAARLLAARQAPGAIDALFNYLPNANDDWIEEEVLASLGELTIRGGKVDSTLTATLRDKSVSRRAAAVYILGRRGDADQRQTIRLFLGDADPLVRLRAAQGLVGKQTLTSLAGAAQSDEQLLKSQSLKIDEPALLDILRKRTLSEEDQKRLAKLVRDLGDPAFKVRSRASRLLVQESTPAIAFLKPALDDGDTELARRAQLCLDEIRRGPGPAVPTAAVRLLARPPANKDYSPAAAVRVLFAYIPFADDEFVEEEVLNSLTVLCAREVKVDPLLLLSLSDPLPARRAAAAHVLGRVGLKEHLRGLTRLLDDPAAIVRFRTAGALVAAREKNAVGHLIAQLTDAPSHTLWQLEDTLQRLAGEKSPTETVGAGSIDGRQKARKAWEKWWTDNASQMNLARLHDNAGFLGLYSICEYDTAIGQVGGQVWETARSGQPRWKFGGVVGAMDVQVLQNGRVLVAENSANRITERDLKGEVKWTYQTPGNPIACQRLPNGNTFIATYNNVLEITPDQKVVYQTQRGPQFYIFSARKTPQGTVVAMTAQGVIQEFDPKTNKDIRSVNLGPNGGWCSVEPLPNGRFLVATMNNNQIREIDDKGNALMSITYPGVFRATRLPNGNILCCSMTTKKVAELDRTGNVRWERTCEGRPWSVRYR